jgi:hypothetical protein
MLRRRAAWRTNPPRLGEDGKLSRGSCFSAELLFQRGERDLDHDWGWRVDTNPADRIVNRVPQG